jgi:hypothetical protein
MIIGYLIVTLALLRLALIALTATVNIVMFFEGRYIYILTHLPLGISRRPDASKDSLEKNEMERLF